MLDGPGLTAPPYSLYCGTTLPAPITSFSNAFTITMVSTVSGVWSSRLNLFLFHIPRVELVFYSTIDIRCFMLNVTKTFEKNLVPLVVAAG